MTPKSSLILYSGGQDSATCLAWALKNRSSVRTLAFNYGQKNSIELQTRAKCLSMVVNVMGCKHNFDGDQVITLPLVSELRQSFIVSPPTLEIGSRYIAARNMIFVSIAASICARLFIDEIVIGISNLENSGYADCSARALKSLRAAISSNSGSPIRLSAPLANKRKDGVWKLAKQLGGDQLVQVILEYTHTCYEGIRSTRHQWGYGCGTCPACELRSAGWIRSHLSAPSDGAI